MLANIRLRLKCLQVTLDYFAKKLIQFVMLLKSVFTMWSTVIELIILMLRVWAPPLTPFV